MQLHSSILILLLLAPSIIGLACVPLFVIVLRRRGVKWAAAVVAFLAVESILAALWTVNTFGMGSGPGMWSFCMAPLMAVMALLLLLISGFSFFRTFGADRARRRFYLIGGLLVVALQLAPLAGYYALGDTCDAQTRQVADQIIAAAETYRQEHKNYPQKLEDLVPTYLSAWPSPACSWFETGKPVPYLRGFALMGTPSGASGFMLTVPSARFGNVQIYDHAIRQWRYQAVLD